MEDQKTNTPNFVHQTRETIEYLDYETFKLCYSFENEDPFSETLYSKIYESGYQYVIKVFKDKIEHGLRNFILELLFLSACQHPCILKPVSWSYHQGRGFLVFPKGAQIRIAYDNGDISQEQIVSDTLHAVTWLNSIGIAHKDIKPDNMIFLDGKCMLIDLGMACLAEYHIDGEYYIKGLGYTENYRDPEYNQNQYCSIKAEIYSLGMSYEEIFNDKELPSFGTLHTHEPFNKPVDWFIERAKLPHSERPSILKLFVEAPTELLVNRYDFPLYYDDELISHTNNNKEIGTVMSWITNICIERRYRAKTLFLCLHNIHRVFDRIYEIYGRGYVSMLGAVCLHLSLIVTTQNVNEIPETSFWQFLSENHDPEYNIKFIDLIREILILMNGIIVVHTYWDYAYSAEDLFPLLIDTISMKYNPKLIRSLCGDSNKDIRACDFIPGGYDFNLLIEHCMQRDIPATYPVVVYASKLDLYSDVKEITRLWSANWMNNCLTERIVVIMRNRASLHMLDLETSLVICQSLYLQRSLPVVEMLLNLICKFKWRINMEIVLVCKFHPFWIMNDDMIPLVRRNCVLGDRKGNVVESKRRKVLASTH